jgi:glycosyltransferase involved in cell wall biosynthesis
MTVSIITPLYNQAHFLSETLESALAQTYTDFEIVIVNDASTDNSLEVATKYAAQYPKKIRVVCNPVNLGLAATRNVGIAHSVGEFILPLDSDDKIFPTYLEKTVSQMEDGVAVVGTWMFMEFDGLKAEPVKIGHPGSSYPIFPPAREQILTSNSIAVCSLVRRTALAEVGGYPEDFKKGSEDWCMWAGIVCTGHWKIKIVEEYLFRYRIHAASMCRGANMDPFPKTQTRIRERFDWTEEDAVREAVHEAARVEAKAAAATIEKERHIRRQQIVPARRQKTYVRI